MEKSMAKNQKVGDFIVMQNKYKEGNVSLAAARMEDTDIPRKKSCALLLNCLWWIFFLNVSEKAPNKYEVLLIKMYSNLL